MGNRVTPYLSGPQHPATLGESLTPPQRVALGVLLAGQGVAAARSAGVDRTTVYRWTRADHALGAALNAARRDLYLAARDQLLALAGRAARTLGRAIDRGSVKASACLLKGLGLLPGTPPDIGPDDPQQLAATAAAWQALLDPGLAAFGPGGVAEGQARGVPAPIPADAVGAAHAGLAGPVRGRGRPIVRGKDR
jgi:hypothetical protein